MAGSTPRVWPVCARRGGGGRYLVVGTVRLQPFCACRGGRGNTGQAARPGCGRSAHAGAGGRTLGRQRAPDVAVLGTPGRGRSYLAVGTPRLQPFHACRGGREDATQAARPGRGRSTHAVESGQ